MITHLVLLRQLKRLKLDEEHVPSLEQWRELLKRIDLSYHDSDQGQYLNEVSIKVSSREMLEKTQELANSITELKQAHEYLIQSEKLLLVGQLSAGIAHEINNPLSFITSNTSVLTKRFYIISQLLERYQKLLDQINTLKIDALQDLSQEIMIFISENKIPAIVADIVDLLLESTVGLDRIKKIVSNLGTFSNINNEEMAKIDINNCIESAIEVVWNKLKYKIDLHKKLSELPLVNASHSQLQLVFINLLLNAAKSIKTKGTIIIESKCVNSTIIVTVSDNGSGISPENLPKIFTPFFTTKPLGMGMGLGLTTAYGIIKFHGGNISVKSELNVGSIFTIEIPIK